MPKFLLQKKEYDKNTYYDPNTKRQEPWPYVPDTDELKYQLFISQVTDSSKNFYPEREGPNRIPKAGSGAYVTVKSIYRIRRQDGSEFLMTKSQIHAFDSIGKPVSYYMPFREIWRKTLFSYKTEVNPQTKNYEEINEGPSGSEEVFTMEFNKQNLKELYDHRQDDLIQFVVKDERQGGAAVNVQDVTNNPVKNFELFLNGNFDDLFFGKHIPEEIKRQMKEEAITRGWIQAPAGGAGEYSKAANPPSGGRQGRLQIKVGNGCIVTVKTRLRL